MARPHQLTSDPVKGRKLITKICAAIKKGHYAERAAELCGVSARSYYEWRKQGGEDFEENKDTIFAEFYEATNLALAKAEDILVSTITKAFPDDPRLAFQMLERRFRHWGKGTDREKAGVEADQSTKPIHEVLREIAINVNSRPSPVKQKEKEA